MKIRKFLGRYGLLTFFGVVWSLFFPFFMAIQNSPYLSFSLSHNWMEYPSDSGLTPSWIRRQESSDFDDKNKCQLCVFACPAGKARARWPYDPKDNYVSQREQESTLPAVPSSFYFFFLPARISLHIASSRFFTIFTSQYGNCIVL